MRSLLRTQYTRSTFVRYSLASMFAVAAIIAVPSITHAATQCVYTLYKMPSHQLKTIKLRAFYVRPSDKAEFSQADQAIQYYLNKAQVFYQKEFSSATFIADSSIRHVTGQYTAQQYHDSNDQFGAFTNQLSTSYPDSGDDNTDVIDLVFLDWGYSPANDCGGYQGIFRAICDNQSLDFSDLDGCGLDSAASARTNYIGDGHHSFSVFPEQVWKPYIKNGSRFRSELTVLHELAHSLDIPHSGDEGITPKQDSAEVGVHYLAEETYIDNDLKKNMRPASCTETDIPTISGASATASNDSSAHVTFMTSKQATVVASYRNQSGTLSQISGDPTFGRHHDITLGNLASGTSTPVTLTATDYFGNTATYTVSAVTPDKPGVHITQSTISSVSSNGATLIWSADKSAASVGFVGTTPAASDTYIRNDSQTSSNVISFAGLNPSTIYYYRLVLTDSQGSQATSTGSFTTLSQPQTLTSAPVVVTPTQNQTPLSIAKPTNVVLSETGTANSVQITWDPVSAPLKVRVYRSQDKDQLGVVLGEVTNDNKWYDNDVVPEQTYYYRLVVVAPSGAVSDPASYQASISSIPTLGPSNIAFTVDSDNQVHITWSIPSFYTSAQFIRVYRSTTQGNLGDLIADSVGGTSYDDGGNLTPGGRYYYVVRIVTNSGNESTNRDQYGVLITPGSSTQTTPSTPAQSSGINLTGLKGRFLLQVQQQGQAWYVDPRNSSRYYLGSASQFLNTLRSRGIGISNADLAKIAIAGSASKGDLAFARRNAGKIFLQVQAQGQAWYVNPVTLKRQYLGRPEDALALIRSLAIGITDTNLSKIPLGR